MVDIVVLIICNSLFTLLNMRNLLITVALLAIVAVAQPASDRVTSLPVYGQLKSANYAGYVNLTEGRRAFYWFVESQRSPSSDPLVLWLNGGPGCSSLLGFSEENGPYTMRHGGNFEDNAFAYSTIANVLYLESPPGVGFSLDTVPAIVWNDTNTAQMSYLFLRNWFKRFPKYRNHKLYLAGESYAGHYVPQLAYQIFTGSDSRIRANMQGFMVGNPCTGNIGCGNNDPTLNTFLQYQGFAALNASVPPDPHANYDPYDLLVPTCPSASLLSRIRFPHPIVDALRKRLRDAPYPYGPCADNFVTAWFNREDVKQAIHADLDVTWTECSNTLNYTINFDGVTDLYKIFMEQTKWHLLIYSGLSDSVVNMAQTQTIVNGLNRPLKVNQFTAWNYPYVYNATVPQLGGFYLLFDRIAWAGVRDAGHMVPQFNPPAAHELFRSFLDIGRPGRM